MEIADSKPDFREDLQKSINVLREGGIVLVPGDTGWGICCDATNDAAIIRIKQLLNHPEEKTLGVICDNFAKVGNYVDSLPDVSWDLVELSTRPLTIVFEKIRNVSGELTRNNNTVGFRITNDIFLKKLCERHRKPLVFTKARKYSLTAKEFLKDIDQTIKDNCSYITKYRSGEQVKAQQASVIFMGNNSVIKIIRE